MGLRGKRQLWSFHKGQNSLLLSYAKDSNSEGVPLCQACACPMTMTNTGGNLGMNKEATDSPIFRCPFQIQPSCFSLPRSEIITFVCLHVNSFAYFLFLIIIKTTFTEMTDRITSYSNKDGHMVNI